jgi:hypothetical protein
VNWPVPAPPSPVTSGHHGVIRIEGGQHSANVPSCDWTKATPIASEFECTVRVWFIAVWLLLLANRQLDAERS